MLRATRREAGNLIRTLINRINLIPGEQRGEIHIEIVGELAAIMKLARREPGEITPYREALVAGAHSHLKLLFETAA
jgi:hypothetical protein